MTEITQTSRLQQAIDVAEALFLEEQQLLLEILAKRLHRTHIPHPQLSQSVFTGFYQEIKPRNIPKLLILTDKANLKGIIYGSENRII